MNSKQLAKRREKRRDNRKNKRNQKMHQKLKDCLDFEKVFSFRALFDAAKVCRRGVMWKDSTIVFDARRCANVFVLHRQLMEGTFKKRKPTHFTLNERGKLRHISAVVFRDRVVQRALCDNSLTKIVENSLIYDNAASQAGKGTSFARNRFEKHLRDAFHKWQDPHIVLGDFSDYFASIDANTAFEMIARKYRNIAFSEAEKKSVERILKVLKIFVCDEDHLGLGNQTSQTIAIYYLNKMDHASGQFGYYGRYMDDFYCICKSKETAKKFIEFAYQQADAHHLRLNAKKTNIFRLRTEKFTFLKRVYSFNKQRNLNIRMSAGALRHSRRHIAHVWHAFEKGKIPPETLGCVITATLANAQTVTNQKALAEKLTRLHPSFPSKSDGGHEAGLEGRGMAAME